MENNKLNKILLICNGVLFLGLIVLYILHYTGKDDNSAQASKVNVNAKAPVQKEGGLKIAYVNTDTLIANYQYAKDLEAELLAFKNQQEAFGKQQVTQFQKDGQKLQAEYQEYLKNANNLTLSQQQAKEADFKKREAELSKRAEKLSTLEQELTAKILERQMSENTKLLNAIFAFVREYNEQNQQFDIIMRKTFENSPTLYMNEAMDITDEILNGLNEEYKNLKK